MEAASMGSAALIMCTTDDRSTSGWKADGRGGEEGQDSGKKWNGKRLKTGREAWGGSGTSHRVKQKSIGGGVGGGG